LDGYQLVNNPKGITIMTTFSGNAWKQQIFGLRHFISTFDPTHPEDMPIEFDIVEAAKLVSPEDPNPAAALEAEVDRQVGGIYVCWYEKAGSGLVLEWDGPYAEDEEAENALFERKQILRVPADQDEIFNSIEFSR
jgi:hypothetical protein